jgi:hypothetical protein
MNVRMMSCALLVALGGSAASAQVSWGLLNVVQNDTGNTAASVAGSGLTVSGGPITYVGGTRGDFAFGFGNADPATDVQQGIMMVTMAQNGRSNQGSTPTAIGAGLGFATPAIQLNPNIGTGTHAGYGSSINNSGTAIAGASSGGEWNANQAVAYFRYDQFIGGWATNGTHVDGSGTNNGPLTGFASSSAGLTISSGASDPGTFNLFDSTATAGLYRLRTQSLSASLGNGASVNATSQNGILLVTGGKNEDNYSLSQANADGSFTIVTRDNGANNPSTPGGENDPVGFVYVPAGHNLVPVGGRVDNEGDALVSWGHYTLTDLGVGEWLLQTPGFDVFNSVLMLSGEGADVTGSNRGDNVWSYAWDATLVGWRIQSRDISGDTAAPTLQDLQANEVAFSFAIIPTPGAACVLALGGLGALRRRR